MALFIPGICGFIGAQGSGKSFSALKLGLLYANQIQYDIAFNFAVDFRKIFNYCLDMGYTWLAHRIYRNHCFYEVGSHDLEEFMRFPKTLYILDEAGVYLNTRKWQSLSTSVIDSLAQIRHDGKLLWWVAQYDEMVDKVLRNLSSSYVFTNSKLRYSKKLGNYEIIWQAIYLYDAKNFKVFNAKVNEKVTGLKYYLTARKLADFHIEGPLSFSDKYLFSCYESFGSRVGDYNDKNFSFHHKNLGRFDHDVVPFTLDVEKIAREARAGYEHFVNGFDY